MRVEIDENNYSLARIEEKCIHCGMCLNTCQDINNIKGCINCGQCILTCPTGALVVKKDYDKVFTTLNDPEKIVVVSTSPSVRVSIGDSFGYAPGEFLESKLVGVLRALGFKYVFDTTFGADLTIMEETTELISRIKEDRSLPMFTSCCPSWITYMEEIYGEDLQHISTCKSPIGMQASIIKEYFAKEMNIPKEKIVTVFLTPCVSKKTEIKRANESDADYVITVSELELMIREKNLDFASIPESEYDKVLGKGSGAGVIFGNGGGVMEAALRTAYYLLNGEEAPEHFYNLEEVRGYNGFKQATVDLKVATIKVAVVNEIANVQRYYNALRKYHFVEVMSCPGGCIGGAGQPNVGARKLAEYREARIKSLYQNDSDATLKESHKNEEVKALYDKFVGHPNSEIAHELLHTEYKNKVKVEN